MRSTGVSAAAAAATLTAALLLSACTTGGSSGAEPLTSVATAPAQSSSVDSSNPAESGDAKEQPESGAAGVEEAAPSTASTESAQDLQVAGIFETALAAVPGVVIGIEDETYRSVPVWTVLVRTAGGGGTEVKIDQVSGEVLAQEAEDLSRFQAQSTQVSVEQAIAVALTEVPGTLLEMELDDEKGTVIWEAKVRGANGVQKVKIDAATAEVLRVKKDH